MSEGERICKTGTWCGFTVVERDLGELVRCRDCVNWGAMDDLYPPDYCPVVRKRGTGDVHRRGYGWCGGLCRWGTKTKTSAIDRYAREKGAVQLVGIAADETERLERANNAGHVHPLAEWGVTEAEALAYCYSRGFEWMERGVRLYDVLDRVSCWCCRNKNLKELRAIHDCLPEYWERLVAMEQVLGPMKKGKTLPEIGASC